MKKCPYCAEEIQDDAIKCKHCKEWLKNVPKTKIKPSSSSERQFCKDYSCKGYIMKDGTCSECGRTVEQIKNEIKAPYSSERQFCKDFSCKGYIMEDGLCSACGRTLDQIKNDVPPLKKNYKLPSVPAPKQENHYLGCLVIIGIIFLIILIGFSYPVKTTQTYSYSPATEYKSSTSSKLYNDNVDSIPGIRDSDLISICKQGCASLYSIGTSNYNNCVYCCTHDCLK